MTGTIYVLQNKVNGKCYVGQTIGNVPSRIKNHQESKYPMGMAVRKYGAKNFEVTKYGDIRIEWLDWAEREMIKYHNCLVPYGYNISLGGNNPMRGRKHTEESKIKMSHARKGILLSEEHKRKLSEAHKGKPNNQLGLKRSTRARERMSLAKKGRKMPWLDHPKPVICIETGVVYNSIKEATGKTGLTNISACCKRDKTIHGFHWEYYKEAV